MTATPNAGLSVAPGEAVAAIRARWEIDEAYYVRWGITTPAHTDVGALLALVDALVKEMTTWGSWEDGVPEEFVAYTAVRGLSERASATPAGAAPPEDA